MTSIFIRDFMLTGQAEEYLMDLDVVLDSFQHGLSSLSLINFFVGANNSGKSRLLRILASEANPVFKPSSYPADLNDLKRETEDHFGGRQAWISEVRESWRDVEFVSAKSDFGRNKDRLIAVLENLARQASGASLAYFTRVKSRLNTYMESKEIQSIKDNPFRRIYIPVLRGLRPMKVQGNVEWSDLYAARTNDDYFSGKFSGEIYSGLTFYNDLKNLLLGDHEQRKTVRDFEDFLSRELFGGEAVTLTPRSASDVVWLKIGDAFEREVYNLGDGMQQLITITFPLFKNRLSPYLAFIEEPELFLHPGMQRALIKAIRLFPNNQYFITTHSNHFLDLTMEFDDISIYSLYRKEAARDSSPQSTKFQVSLVSSHDIRILEILGARTSSVFLSNCTIWIEGITDRRYLSHFLKLYIEELASEDAGHFIPKQDLHFSFVEYSGGNIAHWSFLDSDDAILVDRLCAKAMLVTDRDKGKESRHAKLRNKMNERYYCLRCIEIENILSPAVIKSLMISYGEESAKIREFDQSSYKDQKLGAFMDTLVSNRMRVAGYSDKTGAVKNKIEFCSRAIKAMPTAEDLLNSRSDDVPFSFKDLSPEAKKLTKVIYEFIKNANIG